MKSYLLFFLFLFAISTSFSQTPDILFKSSIGVNYLTEKCSTTPDTICFQLPAPATAMLTFSITLAGNANPSTDYTTDIPTSISFAPGSQHLCYSLSAINDNLAENAERIEIILNGNGTINKSINLPIQDDLTGRIMATNDTLYVCANTSITLEASGAATYNWAPANVLNPRMGEKVQATIAQLTTVTVTGAAGSCSWTDQIVLRPFNPQVTASALDRTTICVGQQVRLSAVINTNGIGFSWTPGTGLNNPNTLTPVAKPISTTAYIAQINLANCTVRDTVNIEVDEFKFPLFSFKDTTICQGSAIQLASPNFDRTTRYDWTPGTYLNDSTSAFPTAFPEDTVTYKLIATSRRGYCRDSIMITINTRPIDVNISSSGGRNADTVMICLGDQTSLTAQVLNSALPLRWSPTDSIITGTPTSAFIVVKPSISTTYTVMISDGACSAEDKIYVRVDSLPDMGLISEIPVKNPYCVGDEIVFRSKTFDYGKYPDIQFEWSPQDGAFQNEYNEYDVNLLAQATTTYRRETNNGACTQTDTIRIIVEDPIIEVNPVDTIVCPSEPVKVTTKDDGIKDLEWMPEQGLSGLNCPKCPNPTIRTPQSMQYTVQGKRNGCPVSGSTTINVFRPASVSIGVSPNILVPVNTEVTINTITNATTTTYNWKEGNNNLADKTASIKQTKSRETTETYTVTFTDQNGCPAGGQTTITWFQPPFNVQAPNAFTPNGDGENDYFNVKVDGGTIEELLIFNRFGQLVYNHDNPAQGWDGRQGGKYAPADTYVYRLKVRTLGGEIKNFAGNFILIR